MPPHIVLAMGIVTLLGGGPSFAPTMPEHADWADQGVAVITVAALAGLGLVASIAAAWRRGRRHGSTESAEAEALAATLQRRILRRGRMLIDDDPVAAPPAGDRSWTDAGGERSP